MAVTKLQTNIKDREDNVIVKKGSFQVKWFSLKKGYGFLEPDGEDQSDIFLHFSTLETAGCQHVSPGDTVVCDIVQGDAGKQVAAIYGVETLSGNPSKIQLILQETTGTVKWFNVARGYGFIKPDDGGSDIFVHSGALRGTGLDRLLAGQQLALKVLSTERGREARDIRLVSSEAAKS
jgi:CspA family cold shock protein